MTGKRAGQMAAALMSVAALATSCTKAQLQGQSSSYLILDALEGGSVQAAGAATPTFSGVLDSDVCVHTTSGCSVFDDLGQATFQLALKDPGASSAPTTPTTTNFITITSYHVDYARTDGRNTQGVDVPFSFDGAATATVGGSPATVVVTLVRVQAKLEAPLVALSQGSTVAISTIATVTFYGADQAGRAVSVVGQIGVTFADFADPPSGGGSGS